MPTASDTDVYYDPYDFEIDADPYPIWKRMRDEAPLYYNEKYDFYALSRFDDVEQAFDRLGDVPVGPRLDPRAHPRRHRDPAGHVHLRGPADPRRPPRLAVAGVHAEEDERHRAARSASSAPARSIRSSARAASTSSATSARRCRCGRSACCSASPRRTRRRSATGSTRSLRLEEGAGRRVAAADATATPRCSPTTSTGAPSIPPTTS